MAIGIDSLTTGVDINGMTAYIESLNISLLENIKNVINDYSGIEEAINAGWQGQSAKKFLDDFTTARTNIISDIEAEYDVLEARLEELKQMYFKIDAGLM